MKIALVCSAGGHLTEMLRLLPAMEGHEVFFVTYDDPRGRDLPLRKYLTPRTGERPHTLLTHSFRFFRILWRERPHVIISTGAELAIPFTFFGKLMGAYTIYIESWCRIHSASLSGRIVYPFVDEFLVQWPQMLNQYGAKARFEGAVA